MRMLIPLLVRTGVSAGRVIIEPKNGTDAAPCRQNNARSTIARLRSNEESCHGDC